MKNENVWKTYGEKELQELHAVNEKYKNFSTYLDKEANENIALLYHL